MSLLKVDRKFAFSLFQNPNVPLFVLAVGNVQLAIVAVCSVIGSTYWGINCRTYRGTIPCKDVHSFFSRGKTHPILQSNTEDRSFLSTTKANITWKIAFHNYGQFFNYQELFFLRTRHHSQHRCLSVYPGNWQYLIGTGCCMSCHQIHRLESSLPGK